jgi:hypothetical protein
MACLALVPGGALVMIGAFLIAGGHSSGPGAFFSCAAFLFISLLLFAIARVISLLAEIAANTRK